MKFKKIELPHDGGPHKNIVEWWYFNGLLRDKSGREYSFMDCLFQVDLKKINLPFLKLPFGSFAKSSFVYFAHSIVSDIKKQKAYKDVQILSLPSADSFSRPLMYANYIDLMSVAKYVNCEIVETKPSCYHLKTEKFDLELKSNRKPLLEGGKGFIEVCGRQSFYYSLTDFDVAGEMRLGGETVSVSGKAWMDHQWADVAYAKDKWSWFSLKLDNGLDVMCVEYDDGDKSEFLVDIIDKENRQWHSKKLVLKPAGKIWKSQKTKAEYPLAWEVIIPGKDIKLRVEAKIKDQEMVFGTINYWEGPLKVEGTVNGEKVGGFGFMELVGYPSDYNFLVLTGKEVNKRIKRTVSTKFKKIF